MPHQQPRGLSPSSTRGRQTEARRNDQAVLDAARAVFAEHGPDASIATVAARAGVGVGTLYRRYGSKTELLQQLCLQALEQIIEVGHRALAERDPWRSLVQYVEDCVALRTGALVPLAGRFTTTPQLRDAAGHGLDLLDRVVGRAHRTGALRPDATAQDVVWLIKHFSRDDADPAVRARLLAVALAGLHTGPPAPLPDPPPDRQAFLDRWDRGRTD